jgi:hypothetical protein
MGRRPVFRRSSIWALDPSLPLDKHAPELGARQEDSMPPAKNHGGIGT